MKSYNHLYETYISYENIELAIQNGIKGKTKRKDVKRIADHLEEFLEEIREYADNFHPYEFHTPVIITDGCKNKQREIIVPEIHEHIIHHMIVQTMKPMFTKGMYKHTYSSIPGRGMHKCRKRVSKWMKDKKHTKYCLKLDIRKFFNSIQHDVLIERLEWCIHDKKFLRVLRSVINSTESGLPLGFYTSHWFANWLLQPLDHYIKEELHIKYYIRYMDDMVLFAKDKETLHHALDAIREFLDGLKLTIKDDWQIFRVDYIDENGKHKGRALDFCGFKFYRDRVQLRKSLLKRFKHKANKINKKKKCTIHDAHQLMAYLGYVDWADVYQVYKKYIAPNMSFRKCKDRISQYNKHQNKEYKNILQSINSL